mmetsp:Transcript_5395/g.4774  ORF Transcript_5395/g.4774 Transcript_5395/m.4774 type:complete len:184 (+) Transcript_5395:574-1125(+)
MKRIINNLLSNALKHTIRGDIKLYSEIINSDDILSRRFENDIHVGADIKYNQFYLMFEITDNGKGIPQDKLAIIFNDLESDQKEDNWDGTGLGLPICLTICKNMNAFICYASIPYQLTIFRLFIPYKEAKNRKRIEKIHSMSSLIKSSEESKFLHQCNKVLLADDNPHILKKYEKILNLMKVD